MEISLAELAHVCGVTAGVRLQALVPHLNAALEPAEITTPLRLAMYLAQLSVESQGFSRAEENLNYSAERLTQVWPHRFPALALAQPFEHNPEALANYAYADRLGNGDKESGDGWRFRGRGWIQLTGWNAYRDCGLYLGIDLRATPELLAEPKWAALSAAWFWRTRGLNAFADKGDVIGATKRINGGLVGIDDRKARYARACEVLCVLNLNLA